MRLPVRRIWRAFPELDRYHDDECRLFVRQARGRLLPTALQTGFACAVLIGGLVGGFQLLSALVPMQIARAWTPRETLIIYMGLAVIVGLPAMAALLVRDWFLRRRLRHVLRDRGSCPRCRYSLVGLVIPASLEIACPECGHACQVDPSLSVLSRPGGVSVVAEDARIALLRAPFWTAQRKRRWKRGTLVTLLGLLLVIGVPLLIYEWQVRAELALARSERPTAADLTRLIERHRPGMPRSIDPRAHAFLRAVGARMEEMEAKAWMSEATYRPRWSSFDLLHDAPIPAAMNVSEDEEEAAAREAARRMFDALAREGLTQLLLEIRSIPIEVRDTEQAPETQVAATTLHLPAARRAARFLSAAALEALERGDPQLAQASLEALFTIARACQVQPTLAEVLASSSIESLGRDSAMRWLLARPSEAEVDGIESLLPSSDDPMDAALAIECEVLAQKALIASLLSEPALVRLAPLGGWMALLPGNFSATTLAPGSWPANRDAIDRSMERWLAKLALDSHASSLAVLPPAGRFDRAGLATMLVPAVDRFIDAVNHRRLGQRSLRVMVALERWRLGHGGYPEKLDQLVPSLLPSVPIDPWTGQALGYRRMHDGEDPRGRGYLLYTLGSDGIDDGGKEPPVEPGSRRRPRNRSRPFPRSVPIGWDLQLNALDPAKRGRADAGEVPR